MQDVYIKEKAEWIEQHNCYANFNRYPFIVENLECEKLVLETPIHNNNVYYLFFNTIVIPHTVIGKIIAQSYTKEDVIRWITTNDDWTDLPGPDEIRSTLLPLLRGDFIESALSFKLIEKISGPELYKKNPIGSWYQQGDTCHRPELSWQNIVEFKDLSPSMKIRLVSNIWYELYASEITLSNGKKVPLRFLKMGNASWYERAKKVHIEMVSVDCNTVIEALTFRNGTNLLPKELS